MGNNIFSNLGSALKELYSGYGFPDDIVGKQIQFLKDHTDSNSIFIKKDTTMTVSEILSSSSLRCERSGSQSIPEVLYGVEVTGRDLRNGTAKFVDGTELSKSHLDDLVYGTNPFLNLIPKNSNIIHSSIITEEGSDDESI